MTESSASVYSVCLSSPYSSSDSSVKSVGVSLAGLDDVVYSVDSEATLAIILTLKSSFVALTVSG